MNLHYLFLHMLVYNTQLLFNMHGMDINVTVMLFLTQFMFPRPNEIGSNCLCLDLSNNKVTL